MQNLTVFAGMGAVKCNDQKMKGLFDHHGATAYIC